MVEVRHNIDWFVDEPERLLKKLPFCRGGESVNSLLDGTEVNPNEKVTVEGKRRLRRNAISQEVYLCEYEPALHAVTQAKSMPRIVITLSNGHRFGLGDVVLTSAYQKVIHATQIQTLSHSPMKFVLCNDTDEMSDTEIENLNKDFAQLQKYWNLENEESRKADIYGTQKSCGDVGVLFEGASPEDVSRRVIRYKDGYTTIPNTDEYGREVATSMFYAIDEGKTECIDTYAKNGLVYSFERNTDAKADENNSFKLIKGYPKSHGYVGNPLLYHRSCVAWEYVQSYITTLEIMENVLAKCQMAYSTFMMVMYGSVDQEAVANSVNEIMCIEITNPTGNEKVEVIEFPQNQSAYDYIKHLKEQIQMFSFTTMGTSESHTSGSDSRGGAMTMRFKADLALAKQTILDYADFWAAYIKLFCQAMDWKYNDGAERFSKLLIKLDPQAWTPISDSLMIDNIAIAYEKGFLSMQTAIEICPLSARDELQRKLAEMEQAQEDAEALAETADSTEVIETEEVETTTKEE